MRNFKNPKIFIILIVVLMGSLLININISAAEGCTTYKGGLYDNICVDAIKCGDLTLCDVLQVGINLGRYIFSVIGAVVLLFFIYGGLTWITSMGIPARVQKGKDILVNSVIGMLIVFSAYSMVVLTVELLTKESWSWEANLGCPNSITPCVTPEKFKEPTAPKPPEPPAPEPPAPDTSDPLDVIDR